jgi:hypothetical protein
MCHCTIRIYNPKPYHRMKALHRNTRLKHAYNPMGELVNIMAHKINVIQTIINVGILRADTI